MDVEFWRRIWKVVQRLMGSVVLLGAHAGFDRLVPFVVHRYPAVEFWSAVGLNVAFLSGVHSAAERDDRGADLVETSLRNASYDRRSWALLYVMSFSFAVTVAPVMAMPNQRADEIAVILAAPIVALLVVPRLARAMLGRPATLVLHLPRLRLTLLWDDAVIGAMAIAGVVVQAVFALRAYWRFNFGTAGSWLALASYVLLLVVMMFVLQSRVLRRHI